MSRKTVRMVCAKCGGTNVRRDAWSEWSEENQSWELIDVLDMAICDDCGGETTIKEVTQTVGRCANGCAEIVPTRSASAYWDRDKGAWVLNEDMEEPYCPECNGAIVWGWA